MPPEVLEQIEKVTEQDDVLSDNDMEDKDTISIPIDSDSNNIEVADRPRILDLSATPRILPKYLENIPLIDPSINYLIYFKRAVQYLFLTLLFDWTAFITHPINFLMTFVFFPLVAILLFFFEIILRFVAYMKWNTNDDETVLETWSKLSPSPHEIEKNLRLGMESLDKLDSEGFDLNRAQFLLYLSTIMYERDHKKVDDAHYRLSKVGESTSNKDLNGICKLLKEAEVRICEQIKKFNLQFTSLSELNSLGGPFTGMFWSNEGNFIVIACKGTTATNFSEWLTNASFQRIDARPFLFGEVHEGFYSMLFPLDEYDSERLNKSCPATRIIDAVNKKGQELRKRNTNDDIPINVYITGHSLGGALANLMFGRLLKSPQSLGTKCILRDGITFASPSIGDNDFSAEFASLCNRSTDEYKTLWRVVCDSDVVPRVPPGHHNPSLRRYTNKIQIMNYFHVGDEVRFYQDGSKPASIRDIFNKNEELMFLERGLEWSGWRSIFGFYDPLDYKRHKDKLPYNAKYDTILYPSERFLIPLFRNHMSHRYFVAMEKSRRFFEKEENNNFIDDEKDIV